MQKFSAIGSVASSLFRRQTLRRPPAAPFSTSLLFDDTQKQFKESVTQFAQENIAPYALKIDRSNYFPEEVNLWKLMGDFNLLGITAPEEYGGLGLGYLYHCTAMEEISRASGSVGLSYGEEWESCSEAKVLAKVNNWGARRSSCKIVNLMLVRMSLA